VATIYTNYQLSTINYQFPSAYCSSEELKTMEPNIAPNVRWGEWISEGWQMFASRWIVWALQTLIFFIICAIPVLPLYLWMIIAAINEAETGQPQEPPVILLAFLLLVMPIVLLIVVFFWGGFWRTATKQLRGEDISVWDLFSNGGHFPQLLGAAIPFGILYLLGALLGILPAFIVQGLLHFTVPLIVDRGMSVGSAFSASFNATKRHWLMFSLFAFVVYLLGIAGTFICYVGLLATYPLQFTIMAIAYRDTFGIAGARSFAPILGSTATSYAGQSWQVSPQQATPPPPPRPLFAQTVESQQQPALHCSQCGAAITRVAKFCNICGSPLQS
jgi:hypothetical protein